MAATIFAANESQVTVDGKAVDGVRSLEYRKLQARENIYGLGTQERVDLVSGGLVCEVRLRVASNAEQLDHAQDGFQIVANLVHGNAKLNVTFFECYLQEKSFDMSVGSFGEAVYTFSASRVEEAAP